MTTVTLIAQTLCIVLLAPLISGLVKRLKNNLRMRTGPGVLQPYFNLVKLMAKGEVVSEHTSWVFRAAPAVVLASAVTAAALVPFIGAHMTAGRLGDFVALILVLALGRFFLALAGLDAGSAFGGMGSSREMFISSLAEPVIVLSLFVVSLNGGSSDPATVAASAQFRFSSIIAAAALFLAMLAETSRVPVDNQETHLELTMVHEAMVLEYSGPSLAFLELAAHVKQMVFFALAANVVLPPLAAGASLVASAAVFALKTAVVAAVVALIEVTVAKMRLFRAVDFLSFGFVLAGIALVVSTMGM